MSNATIRVGLADSGTGGFDRRKVWLGRGVSGSQLTTIGPIDFYLRLQSPTLFIGPEGSKSVEVWSREGTVGGRLEVSRRHAASPASSASRRTGWIAQWIATRQVSFLDSDQWDNAGTVEVGRLSDWGFDLWEGRWAVDVDVRAGIVYSETGGRRNDTEPFLRMTGSVSVRRPFAGFVLGGRGFVGLYAAGEPPVAQRALPLDGADPYQTLRNPFVRTRGAPLVTDDVQYHSPGNGNLRGFRRGLGRWLRDHRRGGGVERSDGRRSFRHGLKAERREQRHERTHVSKRDQSHMFLPTNRLPERRSGGELPRRDEACYT